MKPQMMEKIIQGLKRDPNYSLDPNLGGRVLTQILYYRGITYIRGLWRRIALSGDGSHLFMGAGVRIRHPQLISLGRSVIIEDHVTIDALSQNGVQLGDNVTIGRFSTIQCTGVIRALGVGLTIGNNSAIGAYSYIGAQGGVEIGSSVIMGPRVSIHAENHRYDNDELEIRLQGESRQGITIGDDCWIGAGSTVLDGVQIEKGCVVAAGSVVTRNVPAYSVIAGVPALEVKKRK